MSNDSVDVSKTFGNKLRVRVCGLHIRKNKILLIKHKGLGKDNVFWAPPGGGVEFGETLEKALQREMLEECNGKYRIDEFLFHYEFVKPPLHALEYFFKVSPVNHSQKISIGKDPELDNQQQIIEKVAWLSEEEVKTIHPDSKHGIFSIADRFSELMKLKGLFSSKK